MRRKLLLPLLAVMLAATGLVQLVPSAAGAGAIVNSSWNLSNIKNGGTSVKWNYAFQTVAAGTIKTITFETLTSTGAATPAIGGTVAIANRSGISASTVAKATNKITVTVTTAAAVPAATRINLSFSGLTNMAAIGNYTTKITTKTAAAATIDTGSTAPVLMTPAACGIGMNPAQSGSASALKVSCLFSPSATGTRTTLNDYTNGIWQWGAGRKLDISWDGTPANEVTVDEITPDSLGGPLVAGDLNHSLEQVTGVSPGVTGVQAGSHIVSVVGNVALLSKDIVGADPGSMQAIIANSTARSIEDGVSHSVDCREGTTAQAGDDNLYVCSMTANFQAGDVGKTIGGGGMPGGDTIAAVTAVSSGPFSGGTRAKLTNGIPDNWKVTNAVWSAPAGGTITYTTANLLDAALGSELEVADQITVRNSQVAGYNKVSAPVATLVGLNGFTITGTGANPGAFSATITTPFMTTSDGVTQDMDVASGNPTTSTRSVMDATNPAASTICSLTAMFASTDVGLPVLNGTDNTGTHTPQDAYDDGTIISSVIATNTGACAPTAGSGAVLSLPLANTLDGCTAGLTPVCTETVVGLPQATANADGDVVGTQGISLYVSPAVSPGSPPCSANKVSGFVLPLLWHNPGGFEIGNDAVGPPQDFTAGKATGTYTAQIGVQTTTILFTGFLQQLGTPPTGATAKWAVIFPNVPLSIGVCPGTNLGASYGFNGLSLSGVNRVNNDDGATGPPGTGQVRGLRPTLCTTGATTVAGNQPPYSNCTNTPVNKAFTATVTTNNATQPTNVSTCNVNEPQSLSFIMPNGTASSTTNTPLNTGFPCGNG